MRELILTFDEDGGFEADARGFRGKGCEAALDKLIGQIGAKAVMKKRKPEYQLREVRAEKRQQIG